MSKILDFIKNTAVLPVQNNSENDYKNTVREWVNEGRKVLCQTLLDMGIENELARNENKKGRLFEFENILLYSKRIESAILEPAYNDSKKWILTINLKNTVETICYDYDYETAKQKLEELKKVWAEAI